MPEIFSIKKRIKVRFHGTVQGVGFRPFVWRLARRFALTGWVANSPEGAVVEAEGSEASLGQFLVAVKKDKPARASIQRMEVLPLGLSGDSSFVIQDSQDAGDKQAWIIPDTALCGHCLGEILDPADRRYQYPFTHCMHCGPRYSILEKLPYDRAHTSMKDFRMCEPCLAEYHDPENRRYHAQPNACPDCGPWLELLDEGGQVLFSRASAFQEAADLLRSGKILALKGLGGFQLAVDAADEEAVSLLRRRKRREEKPLAVMMPTLEWIKNYCEISKVEEKLLLSPESPIVLLRRKQRPAAAFQLAPSVAPGNPALGVFLPYTPLHHLLLGLVQRPLVMTSGNISDEPMAIQNEEALRRLHGIADYFLVHNRRIARVVDDSVARVILGAPQILRRARGYAPLPIPWPKSGPRVLCVGGQLKNTIAQSSPDGVFLSQHIGDLETEESRESFIKTAEVFQGLYEAEPDWVCRDKHPDYYSSRFAEKTGKPVLKVQHHYAHILSCMAEHGLEGPVLGVAWDGTGYGDDGTIWGGEFLMVDGASYQRVASFRPFRLPGSEWAVREGRRSALGLLHAMDGERGFEIHQEWIGKYFSKEESSVLGGMLSKGFQSPWTSSAGRLFDATASLLGIRSSSAFEGQAAMELEFAAASHRTDDSYEVPLVQHPETPDLWLFDWEPMVRQLLEERSRGMVAGLCAAKFHNTLVELIVSVCNKIGQRTVALSGGCFQNQYLLERSVRRLGEAGYSVFWQERIPTNDGGIALGQAEAARRLWTAGKLGERTAASCV